MPNRSETEPADERLAAAIVAAVTGCGTKRLDVGGLQRADYALLDGGGEQIGVLEVTMFTDEDQNKFWSDRETSKRAWSDPALRCHWLVSLDHTRRLKGLQVPVSKAPRQLEADGVTFVSTQPLNYRMPVAPMPAELTMLGITELQVEGVAKTVDAIVRINTMPVDVSSGVEHATEAVEDRLEQDDNKRKLAGPWSRRELFVWVDSISRARSALSTYSPMPERVAASRPPRLSDAATAVWAALFPFDERCLAMALWRGDRDGWRVVVPPESTSGSPVSPHDEMEG